MIGDGSSVLGGLLRLEKYNGKRDPQKADLWLKRMKAIMHIRLKDADIETKLLILELHLEDKANYWYEKKRKEQLISDLATFEAQFRKEFTEAKIEDEVKLEAVQQLKGETVSDYADRVEALSSHMKIMREPAAGTRGVAYDIRTRPFLRGLYNNDLRLFVTARVSNATMEVARKAAEAEEEHTKSHMRATAFAAIEKGQTTIYLADQAYAKGTYQSGRRPPLAESSGDAIRHAGEDDRQGDHTRYYESPRGKRRNRRYQNYGGDGYDGNTQGYDRASTDHYGQYGQSTDQHDGERYGHQWHTSPDARYPSYGEDAPADGHQPTKRGGYEGSNYRRTYENAADEQHQYSPRRTEDTVRRIAEARHWPPDERMDRNQHEGSEFRGRGYRGSRHGERSNWCDNGGDDGDNWHKDGEADRYAHRRKEGQTHREANGTTQVGQLPASTLEQSARRGDYTRSKDRKVRWKEQPEGKAFDRIGMVREMPSINTRRPTIHGRGINRTAMVREVLHGTGQERIRATGPDPLTGDMEAYLGEDLRVAITAAFDSRTTKTLGCTSHKRLLERKGLRVDVQPVTPPLRFHLADTQGSVVCREAMWTDMRLRYTPTKTLVLRRIKIYLIEGSRIPMEC
eukprot:GHVU01031462.1.p1 GENE.GHVU01031462.1~~GHVU01031462.1.p1  ORF type:complete len:626 (-),score=74.34 GHVU01031462.1:532-2409(-)